MSHARTKSECGCAGGTGACFTKWRISCFFNSRLPHPPDVGQNGIRFDVATVGIEPSDYHVFFATSRGNTNEVIRGDPVHDVIASAKLYQTGDIVLRFDQPCVDHSCSATTFRFGV